MCNVPLGFLIHRKVVWVMGSGLLWLVKLVVAGFFLSVVAGVFSWQLISLRIQEHLVSYEQQESSSAEPPSPFFYNTVGSSPETPSSLPLPVVSVLQRNSSEVPSEPSSSASSLAPRYTIKVEDVATEKEAQGLLDLLNKAGLPAFTSPLTDAPLAKYRITMGLFSSEEAAEEALKTLRERTTYTGHVVVVD